MDQPPQRDDGPSVTTPPEIQFLDLGSAARRSRSTSTAVKSGVSPEINAISTIVVPIIVVAITALAIIVAWRLGTFKNEDAVAGESA